MKYIILGHLSPEWIGRPRKGVQSVKAKAAELDITIDGIYDTQG